MQQQVSGADRAPAKRPEPWPSAFLIDGPPKLPVSALDLLHAYCPIAEKARLVEKMHSPKGWSILPYKR